VTATTSCASCGALKRPEGGFDCQGAAACLWRMRRRKKDRLAARPVVPNGEWLPEAGPMSAELHYLFALLTFSDAFPISGSIEYRPGSGSGVLVYARDGELFRLVVARADLEPA
jgi:hypothetical protein